MAETLTGNAEIRVKSTVRIQTNVMAQAERRLLNWLCPRLPSWVTPDHLTLFGVLGAVFVFLGYIGSYATPVLLWLAILGYGVHWFGDSLDGSLARFRKIERPRYGYFLDHSVDAVCNLIIMMSLGATHYVRMDSALFALTGYYMLCMYVFLNNQVSGTFRLTFLALGPTELRIVLIGLTLAMYSVGTAGVTIGGAFFSYYDFVLIGGGIIFVALFLASILPRISELRRQEAN
ncbi:CDP-alcohol phosphatidyltransferase family protein [Beijerinckia mobilis]|uniref:CDP-alcohol phosphatidyltransferase family protein n=1 Tax=Beijerinckia mobilis TaxID=231434 RepID=UPI00068B7A72|nr:CDP-alcohol phosphatidyltransferase family protein [Beijerinckia mobilis]